jgi:hypothetical protein
MKILQTNHNNYFLYKLYKPRLTCKKGNKHHINLVLMINEQIFQSFKNLTILKMSFLVFV